MDNPQNQFQSNNQAPVNVPQNNINPPIQEVSPEIVPEKKGLKKVWIIIIAVVLAGGIAGGGTYAYFNNKATKEKNDLQTKINEANDQIDTLNGQIANINSNANTNSNIVTNTNANANTNTTVDPTAGWKTYTNTTYKYSIKYPATWAYAQAKTVDVATEAAKNATINLTLNNATKLTIIVESKAKYSGVTLNQFTTDYVTPKDKATITSKSTSTIGSLSGYQEMVKISDPASSGIWYFAENNSYFFVFISKESTQSTDIKSILSTFTITS